MTEHPKRGKAVIVREQGLHRHAIRDIFIPDQSAVMVAIAVVEWDEAFGIELLLLSRWARPLAEKPFECGLKAPSIFGRPPKIFAASGCQTCQIHPRL
jgi:hypothetical protein